MEDIEKNIADYRVTSNGFRNHGEGINHEFNPLHVENLTGPEMFGSMSDLPGKYNKAPTEGGNKTDVMAMPKHSEVNTKQGISVVLNHTQETQEENSPPLETYRKTYQPGEALDVGNSSWSYGNSKIGTNESNPNIISFKAPLSRVPESESLGFSFSPRFEEAPRPLREPEAPEWGPALNPFEDIERQGRCSLLNHPKSPPGSRHHSRSGPSGSQMFGPFPSAMKTSKETGDQLPVLHPSPLLYRSTKTYDFISGVDEDTGDLDLNFSHQGLRLEYKNNTGEASDQNDLPLDMARLDVLLSEPTQYQDVLGSIRSNDSKSCDLNTFSTEGPGNGNRSDFTTLEEDIVSGIVLVENTGIIPEKDWLR